MFKSIMFAAAIVAATPAFAATSVLYASNGTDIFKVSTATGAATLVGATGLAGTDSNGFGSIIRDLASSETTLYGAQTTFSRIGSTGALVTINPLTGMITSTQTLTGLRETGSFARLTTLAYDNRTNTLFGSTVRSLYTINPITGASNFVGRLPTPNTSGLGFNGNTNTLYAIGVTFDALDATITNLYSLSSVDASVLSSVVLANECGCDIAFDPLTNRGYITNIVFDASGNLVSAGLDVLNSGLTATSFVGPHGAASPGNLNGLAFLGTTGGVPEPASWALMISGFGLAGMSLRGAKNKVRFALK